MYAYVSILCQYFLAYQMLAEGRAERERNKETVEQGEQHQKTPSLADGGNLRRPNFIAIIYSFFIKYFVAGLTAGSVGLRREVVRAPRLIDSGTAAPRGRDADESRSTK